MRAKIALAATGLIFSSLANAAIVSTSGDVLEIAPPTDASWEALENNDYAPIWFEGTTTLTQSLETEMGGIAGNALTIIPGTGTGFTTEVDGDFFYDSGNASTQANWGGDLAAGTYNSYMLHADKQSPPQIL